MSANSLSGKGIYRLKKINRISDGVKRYQMTMLTITLMKPNLNSNIEDCNTDSPNKAQAVETRPLTLHRFQISP